MRKSLVLALVLVFAIAGASMAAPSFSGNVTLKAESNKSFTGPFELKPSVRVDANFDEEGENWTLKARVRSTSSGGNFTVGLNHYLGELNAGSVTAKIARNNGLGNVVTPFNWVVLASNPVDAADNPVDQVRMSVDLGGVDVVTQLRGGNDNNLYLRAQTDAGLATVGTGMKIDLSPAKDSVYTGYLTTSVDIVNLRAIVGSFNGTTEYAVGAEVDLTEQLNIDATYNTRGDAGFGVDVTFTEGVLQAEVGYGQKDSAVSASVVYRGSDANQTFDELFDERANTAWTTKWHTNVDPAFKVSYEADNSGSEIGVRGVLPVADNFAARFRFISANSTSSYSVEGWLGLTDNLTLNPEFSKSAANVNTIRAKAIYAVGEGAEISVEGKRVGDDDSLVAAYSINF